MSQLTEKQQKVDQLAREVLLLSRNTLLVHLRFLDAALSQLDLKPGPWPLATDGERIFYDARQVLQLYRAERERPVRDYLHMVLHCVFRHNFVDTLLDHDCWDLACDVAVEAIITELNISAAAAGRQSRQTAVLEELRGAVKDLTAEKLYRHFLDHRPAPERFLKLRELFYADDHAPWYLPPEQRLALIGRAGENASSDTEGGGTMARARAGLAQRWKDISERMQTDLETFSRQRGDTAGGLEIGRASCRERV